jgi:uncharacterized protein YecE (DUF72 family)
MKKHSKGIFRVGTSGIALPGTKDSFPAEFKDKSRLHYYSTIFNSIEINSSFYKIPRLQTLQKWSEETTVDFCFTLKLWKEITHCKLLRFDEDNIRLFLDAASGVSVKGCLLIQFPGKITFDYFSEVENILQAIFIADTKQQWRVAVEFRHASWYTGETTELLNEHRATMVLQDHSKTKNFEALENARFYYFRFHGPKGDYRGSYEEGYLREQASIMREILAKGKDVFAYFNNTMGNAFENAGTLDKWVRK